MEKENDRNNQSASHNILILDDEKSILSSLKRLLTDESSRIFTAENARDALKLISNNNIAVIITDFSMPGSSGADLLQVIKEREPQCIRVILTGAASADSIPDAIADGVLHCQRFLVKPWDDDQLKLTIKECVEEYEASFKKTEI